MTGAYEESMKWILGYGTKLVWNSVTSTLRAPSNLREAVRDEPKGPTRAEMDQDKIRRGRGRRATILTSSQGYDEDLTLGRKSLLG